jgi:hypothetical protein
MVIIYFPMLLLSVLDVLIGLCVRNFIEAVPERLALLFTWAGEIKVIMLLVQVVQGAFTFEQIWHDVTGEIGAALVDDESVIFLIVNGHHDLLAAEHGQLHSLLDDALLPLVEHDGPEVVVANLLEFWNFLFTHIYKILYYK